MRCSEQCNMCLFTGQVVALDSSFTWETGLQTYVIGVQHLQVTC